MLLCSTLSQAARYCVALLAFDFSGMTAMARITGFRVADRVGAALTDFASSQGLFRNGFDDAQ
jgi:hypothetical protein